MISAGDMGRTLGALAGTLRNLADVPRRASEIAAPKITDLLQTEFRAGVDPYNRAWAPLKKSTVRKGRRPPPLTGFTRQLRDGTRAQLYPGNRRGIQLVAGASYGKFHQYGFHVRSTLVPARKIFPDGGRLPKAWSAVLRAAAFQAVREKLRRRGGSR